MWVKPTFSLVSSRLLLVKMRRQETTQTFFAYRTCSINNMFACLCKITIVFKSAHNDPTAVHYGAGTASTETADNHCLSKEDLSRMGAGLFFFGETRCICCFTMLLVV
jgi:hypothetical protein